MPNRLLGAAYMRGDQLVTMVRPFLQDRYKLQVRPFHAGVMQNIAWRALAELIPDNAIVIFVKSAAKGLTPTHIEVLKKKGAIVGFDCIGECPLRTPTRLEGCA